MRPVLTPEEMAGCDRATIESGTPSLTLMERAGSALARASVELLDGAYGRRVVVLCGKGNNAGDGLVAARRLRDWGAAPVLVHLVEAGSALSEDAATNLGLLSRSVRTAVAEELPSLLRRSDLVIDAVFGTGFRGEIPSSVQGAFQQVNGSGIPVISADIPSGVDGTTGSAAAGSIRAEVTVTMGALKPGLIFAPGAQHAGEIIVADIGVPEETIEDAARLVLVERSDVAALLEPRDPQKDKRGVGAVLIVAGAAGMGGAAALSVLGALRGGAGLVTLASTADVTQGLHHVVTEGTTLQLPETASGSIDAGASSVVIERAEKAQAVAVGPGLSTDPSTVKLVRTLCEEVSVPIVLDADGINAFAADARALLDRKGPTVMTPHARELGRLLGLDASEIESDRLAAARRAAEETGAVVLLKGFRTVIAAPGRGAWVVGVGGPVLATGGTGDVLTGLLAAIVATQGSRISIAQAAYAAAWVHGRAGDMLAHHAPSGIIARDVANAIPSVLNEVMED